jgi:mRNA interferase YafQ
MLQLSATPRFKKDAELSKKRGRDFEKLTIVIEMLLEQKRLPDKYRNHKLHGEYKDIWECHIEPDWLLLYKKEKTELILVRLGTHADLF